MTPLSEDDDLGFRHDLSRGLAKGKKPMPATKKTLRVLIVDDNRDGADALGLLLEELNNQVHVTYGGSQALDVATAFRADLMLVDLVIRNDIKNRGWVIMHILIKATSATPQIEEIMFLDRKAPDAYKPLIADELDQAETHGVTADSSSECTLWPK